MSIMVKQGHLSHHPAVENPGDLDIAAWTDHYFLKTKSAIAKFGDAKVTYAIFMRRPVISAPRLAIEWLKKIALERKTEFKIDLMYEEGKWVGAGEVLLYITGSFFHLCDLETFILQKIGPACVAAFNAYTMCADLPKAGFIAMDARHCAGTEMAELMAYAASVGSGRAGRKVGAVGFIANATAATSSYFNQDQAFGTMPHALVGYAGSTLRAAQLFHEAFPGESITILVDYFGKEVSDAIEVCQHFPDMAKNGQLSIRLDTPGSRFVEGLDPAASYAILDRFAPSAIRGYRSETDLRHLVGAGVSAAAIYHIRHALDHAGFPRVKIIVSSGFDPAKCHVMSEAKAPIDLVGTGSFLPERWRETYATADIIEYDGIKRVKLGREFLFRHD